MKILMMNDRELAKRCRAHWGLIVALSGVLLAVGCSSHDEIEVYEAPVEETADASDQQPATPGMMAAAATAPVALTYDTPEGWQKGEVGGMRKAAFTVQDGDKKIEITAIDLAASAGALLPNINRWRQQIQLEPITEEQLTDAVEPVKVGDIGAQYVELLGPEEAESRQAILGVVALHQDKSWFFKLQGDADLALREKERFLDFVKSVKFQAGSPHAGSPTTTPRGPSPHAPATLGYDVPEGWQPGRVGGMRKAAFEVHDGEQKVEITVIDLTAQAGALLPNVNRWRGQIGLQPIDEAQLAKDLQDVPFADVEAKFVELVAPAEGDPKQAILGVIAIRKDKSWFVKMTGDAPLALREKDHFLEFTKSVKFKDQ